MSDEGQVRWARQRGYIRERLQQIQQTGRVTGCTDRQSSARAQMLVRRGLARRCGCKVRGPGRVVAEYELTPFGLEVLAEGSSTEVASP